MKDLFGNPITNNQNAEMTPKRKFKIWQEVNNYPSFIHDSCIRNFSNSDILTYILRDPDKAQMVITSYDNLAELVMADINEVKEAAHLTEREAQLITLAFELGKRLVAASKPTTKSIHSNQDVYDFIGTDLINLDHEELILLTLNTKNEVIHKHRVSQGSLNASIFAPQQILREALKDNANSIIIAHNHPSGNPSPSTQDIDCTKRLQIICKAIEITLLDHIIIGESGNYQSMKELEVI